MERAFYLANQAKVPLDSCRCRVVPVDRPCYVRKPAKFLRASVGPSQQYLVEGNLYSRQGSANVGARQVVTSIALVDGQLWRTLSLEIDCQSCLL